MSDPAGGLFEFSPRKRGSLSGVRRLAPAIFLSRAVSLCAAFFLYHGLTADAGEGGESALNDKAGLLSVRQEFLSNRCMAFGGIGIVAPNVYVVTKSRVNEIMLPGGLVWKGEAASKRQGVWIIDGKVFCPSAEPERFSVTKGLFISFEEEKIYFFDFGTFQGGFYVRQ